MGNAYKEVFSSWHTVCFQEIVSVNVVTIYSSVQVLRVFILCCSSDRGLRRGWRSWSGRGGWEGTGREAVGSGASGLRWRGGWVQKAGEGGASRVEDKEVSDCIYLKILFWRSHPQRMGVR